MADEVDKGNDRAQEMLDDALAKCRKPTGPAPCGFCYYCNEKVPTGARFCDAECRDDWEYEQRRFAQYVAPEPEDVGLEDTSDDDET